MRMEPGSISGAWCQEQGQWIQTGTQEVPSEHQKTLFQFDGYEAKAQVAQGDCGVSLFGDTQKQFGHSPGKAALGAPS